MIGLDPNVIVRYLVQDDENQAELASRLIESKCTEETPAFISVMVLCEMVWVLSRAYGYSRSQISIVLKQILMTDCFEIESTDLVWNAIYDYESGPADFSDYLIAQTSHKHDAITTFSFDKKAAKHKYMTLLDKNFE